MSNLEKDFDSIAAKINAKLTEAAAALQEANRLKDEAGLPSLIYTQFIEDDLRFDGTPRDQIATKCEELQKKMELINVRELESALGQAGWSTSGSYC